jgi:DNA-binding MarR family transcriptional regulator
MELEREISARFENNFHKAEVNIVFTYGYVTAIIKERLGKHKITMQQFNILRILRGQYPNPATINLLKERMLDKMSDASRIVDRLVQKQLVSRNTNSNDRRAVDIIITDKGLELLKKIGTDGLVIDVFREKLSEQEAIQLNLILDKIRG